jgi:hypothetical protein
MTEEASLLFPQPSITYESQQKEELWKLSAKELDELPIAIPDYFPQSDRKKVENLLRTNYQQIQRIEDHRDFLWPAVRSKHFGIQVNDCCFAISEQEELKLAPTIACIAVICHDANDGRSMVTHLITQRTLLSNTQGVEDGEKIEERAEYFSNLIQDLFGRKPTRVAFVSDELGRWQYHNKVMEKIQSGWKLEQDQIAKIKHFTAKVSPEKGIQRI